jgi:hypothetical protein
VSRSKVSTLGKLVSHDPIVGDPTSNITAPRFERVIRGVLTNHFATWWNVCTRVEPLSGLDVVVHIPAEYPSHPPFITGECKDD